MSLGAATAVFDNLAASVEAPADERGGGRVVAPMHGSVVEVFVAPGDEVSAGMRIATVEAMKMQHELLAEIDGTVAEVAVAAGQQVAAGDLIAVIDEALEEAVGEPGGNAARDAGGEARKEGGP
jgi:biotin carboxyl carrier protein